MHGDLEARQMRKDSGPSFIDARVSDGIMEIQCLSFTAVDMTLKGSERLHLLGQSQYKLLDRVSYSYFLANKGIITLGLLA